MFTARHYTERELGIIVLNEISPYPSFIAQGTSWKRRQKEGWGPKCIPGVYQENKDH